MSQPTPKSTVPTITTFQRECLAALAQTPNGIASADEISFRMKRGRNGRLAVTSAFRALLRRDGGGNASGSPLVNRIAPRDRWGCAKWCLTSESRWLISEACTEEPAQRPAGN